jgi:FAD/FMN-containing dehydrogenase
LPSGYDPRHHSNGTDIDPDKVSQISNADEASMWWNVVSAKFSSTSSARNKESLEGRVNRRKLLRGIAAVPIVGQLFFALTTSSAAAPFRRGRPGDQGWPSNGAWSELKNRLDGELIEVVSPLSACAATPDREDCARVLKELKNPYYLGDEVGLTQTLGWVGAWTSHPSVYAVAAKSAADVAAAVNFARTHNLRVVVKGGGHSYQGTSNFADSLLIWTRPMHAVVLHDAFVGSGCEGQVSPQPAVSIGAGAIWGHVYNEVMANAGRYVQGGGCRTVGVAGFINGAGFGSLSKTFGLGGASLIEAEIVTADGDVRLANACSNPDLFWALKGGGSGFGVVTRLTLRTHELPERVGLLNGEIRATSDEAWNRLVAKTIEFYHEALFNPHWGEQIRFRPGAVLALHMVFHSLDQSEAEAVWRPFFDWIKASPREYHIVAALEFVVLPGRRFFDGAALRQIPGLVIADDRPGAGEGDVFNAGDQGEAGQVLYAYQSLWLPAELLEGQARGRLVDALIAAAKHRQVSLHFNKGLAGGRPEAVDGAKETAMNPAVMDAFALAIIAAGGQPGYPGISGHEPSEKEAHNAAAVVSAAMDELRKLTPRAASYVWETDYFEPNWQDSFWGDNYPRLLAIKQKYDPDGLFFLHHGVGSEAWSADGFERVR